MRRAGGIPLQCDEFCLVLCTNPGERAAPSCFGQFRQRCGPGAEATGAGCGAGRRCAYFDGSLTAGEAEQAIEQALPQLERAARSEVMKRGYTYEVHITVSEEYFDTRTYEDEVTLPAGRYRAVRVIIGSGEGHNWWCVMFPPMCLPAAQGGVDLEGVLDGKEEKIVRSSPKYEPRFKIVEWIERLREYLREGSEEDGLETDYFTVTKVDQESTTESKTKPLSIWQGLFPLLWDGQADGREGRLAI